MKGCIESGRGVKATGAIKILLPLSLVAGLAACNEDRAFYDQDTDADVGTGGNVAQVQDNITYEHWHLHESEVPEGTTSLNVLLHELGGDVDLYVEGPDGEDSCTSLNLGTTADECEFDDPEPGTWQIDVYGWEEGSYDYTLTVTLEPSERTASLERVGEVEPDDESAQATSLAASTQRHQKLSEQLPLLSTIAALVQSQSDADASYRMIQDGEHQGQLHLSVSEQGGEQWVSFKLSARDQNSGEHLQLATVSGAPMVFAEGDTRPRRGEVELRSAYGRTQLLLGQDTGTAADIQLLAEPGPVFSEQAWVMEATGLEFIRQ
jgi:hypothetical protein